MAKVSYINPPVDLQQRFDQYFTPLYKTKNSSLRWTGGLVSPRKVLNVTQRSLLPQIKTAWAAMSELQRTAWNAAGAAQGYSGYNLFVQDQSYRLRFGMIGTSTPSTLHAYKCGQITIESPATGFILEQLHPMRYYKMKKVKGTKSQREPVAIDEALQLPLTVGISYRSNLTATGPNPIVKFYGEITYSYQGLDKNTQVGISIPLETDWARQTATCNRVVGHARGYKLVIELANVQGVLQFDALQSVHTGTNYAREFRCNSIAAGFSNYNYQLPPSWAARSAVEGASFGSVYPLEAWL